MSQQYINQDMPVMPNGLPQNWCGTTPSVVPPQKSFNPHVNNGLGSSHSSRDSSPGARNTHIPGHDTQLPAARGNIPASQLPPGRPGISPIPYNLGQNSSNGHTSASVPQLSDNTPHSSPKIQNFSTSTPNPPPLVANANTNDGCGVNNVRIADNTVNKSPNFTPSLVNQQNPSNPQNNVPNLMNMRTNLSNVPTKPPTGQNLLLGQQQQSLIHSSSTPALQNLQGVSALRQDLNQPQTVPRPLSSGPQLQQTSQNEQYSNQQQPISNQYNYNTAPLQRPQPISQLPNQIQQPKPFNQFQPTNLVQPQNQQPLNQVQPQNQQPLNQVQSQNQQPLNQGQPQNQQPLNQVQSPPNLMQQPKPLNQVQPLVNPMQQPPNQLQQPKSFNQFQPSTLLQPQNQQPPNQFQPQNQQPPNQFQPQNQQPPNQFQPQNQQPTNQFQPPKPQPPNQMRPPQIQNQSQLPAYGSNMPPLPPPAASSHPTTPVSNLHSKRYPQPPTQNTNLPQPNLNAVNNYNQQTMYNQNQTQQPYNPQQQQFGGTNYQQMNLNQQRNYQQMNQQMQNLNVSKSGFNKLWGNDNYDLLQCPNVLPEEFVEPPKVSLGQEFLDAANCSHEIFRCTMTKIPENNSLLQKSRLPLGVLIHPFKDLNHLPVIQCNTIVRCRACRTYINPFIFFVDTKRWKCNLCYRVNELPEEFQYDPVSKSYGDPSRRPEIKSSTIEYIAPSEYMLRPPQPAVYLFLLDISRLAVESGYLHTICDALSSQLATLPGDARTQIGFIAYNTTLHFFSLAEGLNQPHEMIVTDVDDVFLPCPDNLLVNLKEHMDLITDLLAQLPTRYQNSFDTGSALGAALQAALKMMSSTGGRVTVFQVSLPMVGPGALTVREDPNQRAGKEAPHLNPATDFYKRLALDCSGHQIAVDLFILNSQYVDIATLSGISRFSGGCMHHFPLYKASKTIQAESLDRCFKRYLNRKIGFEAVMRIRCTRGLSIHTFHGNFFVRSTDLLSLPNVNPDAGFGMQVSIEESLSDLQSVCFQAALLYTSSKGERRIRVHTLCLPVVNTLSDVLNSADQQCIVGILSKMAVDRSLQSSLPDARDAFINVAIDILSSYKLSLNMGNSASGLLAPQSLKLLPLYILALLKYTAFRTGQSTRLDDRVFAMCDMKTLPLAQLIQNVYPDLYPIYRLAECPSIVDAEGAIIPQPRRLQLTARNFDSHGAYILDAGQQMFIYVCPNVSQQFLTHSLGVPNFNSIPDPCYELQTIDNPDNQRLHAFINSLNDEKPYPAALHIIRDNSASRSLLLERLIEDRIESALSYNEFLQHLKTQVK